jgi:cell division protein FtsW
VNARRNNTRPVKARGLAKGQASDLAGAAVARFGGWLNTTFRGQSREFNQLLGVVVFMVIFGLVMVLSASYVVALSSNSDAYSIFNKQLISAVAGFVMLGVLSRTPVIALQKLAPIFYLGFLGVQLIVLFFGTSVYGNKNWIKIFGVSVQPSEFLKLALVLVIAGTLYQRRDYFDDFMNSWMFPLGAMAAATGLVLAGKDLGTGMVMFGLSFVLMILAGMPTKLIWMVLVPVILIVGVMANTGSRKARIFAWLNPDAPDPTDVGWQAKHGIWALAAGGFSGTGLGDSKMKWSWVPMIDNDYIFSVVGEELGLAGGAILIGLYVFLAFALIRILNRTNRLYERFIMYGILSWITIQSLINIGVVLNFLPVLGVPLPLISSGGTSLVATLMTLGIALGIERRNGTGQVNRATRTRTRSAVSTR